ncbi:purine and uridine phosphorylase [Zopfia rhizophila CBS 207.26]|uniref:Purine and uridine phosphorylase n=1 Tax=Zopfia rhizophila CBS 207.26 TaxID=1314779 RepID=A0A6A6E3Z0_9PEZI|nr:purine and uridine phosphorylase [Zopfia rhizophila CBS 207.26]
MAPTLPQLDNSEYAIGWIAALPHERAAAEAMLDKEHSPTRHKHTNDDNIYSLGSINSPNREHNVVIASLPPGRYRPTPAATAASQMLSSFPAVKFGLMVGIGGGIPSDDNDIRLGDVVAMYKDYPLMAKPRKGPAYVFQGVDCSECDYAKEVECEERPDQNPYIHYGTIASGNVVIKDARKRDSISKNCLCFETEAASLINDFPCLAIRGICDYSDTHKNDQWQRYAAATAAAYAKELLQVTNAAGIKSTPEACEVIDKRVQEIKSMVKDIIFDKKQQDMFKWLSPLNQSARHFESRKKRIKDTGTWLLSDPKFLNWSSKIAESQILCCYGDAGAGKTILSSLVIDKLQDFVAQESKIGLGYIYCDYRDQKEQTIENILGAVLKQLLEALPEIPEAGLKIYGERANQGRPLSSTDVVDLLCIACAQFSKVCVCLDALDEIGNLWSLLDQLRSSPSSIQIFITGRHHVQGIIHEYFREERSISIEAHESDIRRFIEHEIGGDNDLEPDAMDETLRKDILMKAVDSAKGVFV